MKIDVYVHSSKEDMWNKGKQSGLSDAAMEQFVYACYEVKLTLEVNKKTGKADIVAVDDRKVA